MTLINNDCERQKLKQLLKALTQFDLLSDVVVNIFDLLYCMKSKLILFNFLVHITGLIANDSSAHVIPKKKLFVFVILHPPTTCHIESTFCNLINSLWEKMQILFCLFSSFAQKNVMIQ